MTTNGDMNPRQPDEDEPIEELLGDVLDFVDETVARITDTEVDKHLRKVLNQSGYTGKLTEPWEQLFTDIWRKPQLEPSCVTVELDGTTDNVIVPEHGAAADLIATVRANAKLSGDRLREAQETLESARKEAEQIVIAAREEADEALAQAARMVRDAKEQAEQIISDARCMAEQAARIAARRRARAPLGQRSRRRWTILGGVAACWVVLEVMTGSAVSSTMVLVVIAALGAAILGGLRALGITRDHPWVRRMASRPWRDGQDVLNVAMRHLPDVFVLTPSGSLLAPNVVELQLNPDDLASLCKQIELGVISSSLTEVYEEQVAEYRARLARPGQAQVYVTASGSVPPGRYRLRQGDPVRAGTRPDLIDDQNAHPAREFSYAAVPEHAYAGPVSRASQDPGPAVASGMTTIMEASLPPVPALRLVTGSSVAETRTSGARAGRGPVELILPDVPTVSREHARFTYSDGRWRISNQGRNGLILNGTPVTGEQPLSDGDAIRWGTNPDAPLSRVEIS